MQDDFDGGMGIPDDELPGGPAGPDMGIGHPEPEMGGEPEAGHRTSGGARSRSSSGGSRKPTAKPKKKAAKAAKKKYLCASSPVFAVFACLCGLCELHAREAQRIAD